MPRGVRVGLRAFSARAWRDGAGLSGSRPLCKVGSQSARDSLALGAGDSAGLSGLHPSPPFAEIVQLLSGVFARTSIVFSEPRQSERRLNQDYQSDLGFCPPQSTTMQAAKLAMFFGVAKTTFDHRAAKPVCRFGLVCFHPLLVCLRELFPFQPLDRASLLRIADTAAHAADRHGSVPPGSGIGAG